ncbi:MULTISPECIES: MFS transporter [unclassified Pseudomonas]|uniref:CynX/NimT family MFS transporter n=1 Tax=unclassified Pseudomonas TaxID=196821 RepID=UPI0027B9CCDF|nr:MFS transporter [Pseudomonas sp. LJDD11]
MPEDSMTAQPPHDRPDTLTETVTLTPAPQPARTWLLLLGLVLVALNLRPALSSIAPLLNDVSVALGLSAADAGLLTTLPVLCLGLFAPLAPLLARRFGSEQVVLWVLLLLAAGILLRSHLGVFGLFAGSLLAGASIGVIGVLLPGIVKRDFPRQAGTMTGVYTMALCLGAALAAASSVPLSHRFDNSWAISLGVWCVPALIAAVLWWPQTRARHAVQQARYRVKGLWRDPLAWQVTLYMGLQSSLSYIVFGWLPSVLIGRGLDPTQAGLLLSGSIMMQVISALTVPGLAARCKDQRLAVIIAMSLTLAGLFGCLYASLDGLWGWAIALGVGQGGTFSLALALIVLRSGNSHIAANLSSMAQGVGYTLASAGPFAVGLVHEMTGSWDAIGWVFAVLGLGAMIAALGAGRNLQVQVSCEKV